MSAQIRPMTEALVTRTPRSTAARSEHPLECQPLRAESQTFLDQ